MININLFKTISYFLSILFFINLGFSIGVYTDSGNYIYYINNDNPQISINISSPLEDITIFGAQLIKNDEVINLENFNLIYLGPASGKINDILKFNLIDFGIDKFVMEDNIYFNLNVKDNLNNDNIKIKGDPINFQIKLDLDLPRLITFENKDKIVLGINDGYNIDFIFSKKISKYNIIINGKEFINVENPSLFEKDYLDNFNLEFTSDDLKEGVNNLTISFSDLAGNSNEMSMPIHFRGEDLILKLLTIQDDSNLKYNYNQNFPNLFNNIIYTKENEFNLKLETNKESFCYFSNSLINFDYYENIIPESKEQFSSSDGLIHNLNIDISKGDEIWVFCRNKIYLDDSLYLSDELGMGKSLIKFKKYDYDPIKILSILPEELTTYSPVELTLSTSVKAVCGYSKSGADIQLLDSQNFLTHNKYLDLESGNHDFEFSCIDLLNNVDKKNINLKVDLNSGVKILSQEPEYTDQSSVDLILGISEDSECRYSFEDKNPQDFPILNLATGTSLERVIPLSGLNIGDNSVYVFCKKGSVVGKKLVNVVFDPDGPKISNIRFINNDIESNYVGSYSSIEVLIDIESLTPIYETEYFIKFYNLSNSTSFTSSTSKIIMRGDFVDAESLKIITTNIIGKKSLEINKPLIFDVEAPQINIKFSKQFAEIECFDIGGSGCNSILYDLSKTSICIPTKEYFKNISVDISNNNYLCAKAIDNAGNTKEKLEPIFFTISNNFDSNENIENSSNLNESEIKDDELEYLNEEDMFESSDSNFDNLNNDPETNFVLISAIFLVLAGIGGSGYYAYKKGYLNNELRKLGINLPNSNSNQSNKSNISNSLFNSNNKNKSPSNINKTHFKHKVSKSDYEKHKDRLNNFLDNQIGKGDKLFNKFDSNNNDVDSKNLTSNSKRKSKLVSKDNLDEFYESSLKNGNKKSTNNIKVDAQDFEEYYKKKKSKKLKEKK